MRTTGGLSWKSLLSKLHPPLPLTSKDSVKILALLNASFRQQLDRQRPAEYPDTEHYTNTHLQSILTNPLFGLDSWSSRLRGFWRGPWRLSESKWRLDRRALRRPRRA